MAEGTSYRLITKFKNAAGDTIEKAWKYANNEITAQNARSFMQAVITNGSIFSDVPTTIDSCQLETTTTTDINVNS